MQEKLSNLSIYLKALGYQKTSQKTILSACQEFINWLKEQGMNDFCEVSISTIQAYEEYLSNRPNKIRSGGLSSQTIRYCLFSINVLFRQLEQEGYLELNPMSGYKLPSTSSEEKSILSQAEIKQLYESCKSIKEHCFLHVYYGLGLRRSEGVNLNLEDIDCRKGWLVVQKGKGYQLRNMPLSPKILKDFKLYLRQRPIVKSKAFLLNTKGERMQGHSALRYLRKLLKQSKLPSTIDLHSLRHSITTHLIEKGMPIEQVRNYLGHQHLESTQRYIHYGIRKLPQSRATKVNRKGI